MGSGNMVLLPILGILLPETILMYLCSIIIGGRCAHIIP